MLPTIVCLWVIAVFRRNFQYREKLNGQTGIMPLRWWLLILRQRHLRCGQSVSNREAGERHNLSASVLAGITLVVIIIDDNLLCCTVCDLVDLSIGQTIPLSPSSPESIMLI